MKITQMIVVLTCLALLLVFTIFQIHFSSNRNVAVPHTSIATDKKIDAVRKAIKPRWDPLRPGEPIDSAVGISCDRTHKFYDFCSSNGVTVLDPTASTLSLLDSTTSNSKSTAQRIRPYPRKWEASIMADIKEFTLTSGPKGPKCQVQHKSPALLFSTAGYTGNFFHDFDDGFIPLYITINSAFVPGEEPILVVSQAEDWWVRKYSSFLRKLSKHPIINLNKDHNKTHCFPTVKIGLISHGFMTINPNLFPNSKSLTLAHFQSVLNKAYSRNKPISNPSPSKPRLVLLDRQSGDGRVILNQNGLIKEAENTGFEVKILNPRKSPIGEVYVLVQSCHAMIGVHGAAMTHLLFLRGGAVVVQVVPLGIGWVSEVGFGKPARVLGMEYMQYMIGVNESSLTEKYGRENKLIKDHVGYRGHNWNWEIMYVYLKEQDIRLDLIRFRGYLKKAYEKAIRFMDKDA